MNSEVNDRVPMKILRNLFCGNCNLQFFIKDLTLRGSRCPMLLHCGHSICESCIQQNLKSTKNIICQLCSFAQSVDQTTESFSRSMYLMGNLIAMQNSRQGKDQKLKSFLMNRFGNFNYEVVEHGNVNQKPELGSIECEECSMSALWYCENCKSNFCEICWSRVHGSARSLMKHCKTAITSADVTKSGWRKCPVHETQDLEFYCKGCSTVVCSHCVILQHQGEGHCPITLKEKNVEMISAVKTAAEEAEKISKRMKHTLEKIKLTQSSFEASDPSFPNVERQITEGFSQMHGILQLEEERLLKELRENWNQRENCIQALRQRLESQIQNVESLLLQYEVILKKPQDCDLTDLHRQLKEVQSLPCYLISQNACTTEAKVTIDDSVIESIRNYCRIDLPPSEIFELCSTSNLPQGYAVEPLISSDTDQNQSFAGKAESSVSDVDTLSNCSSRDLAKRDAEMSFPKPVKGQMVFQERKNYSVRVSYIKNPGEFYITLNSLRHKQHAIDKRASQYANCSSVVPESVSKDEIYFVKYNVDKKWYRARVVEVFPPKKIGGEEFVLVYYLDYGNSEAVPISRLRPIPPDMLEPPLAVKCKLFDCVPKGGEWCVESTKTMEKILNNCTATMFVMKVHRLCLEVDLSVIYPDGQIGRDIVSVRDALLFLEFSNFVHGSKVPRNATAVKYFQQWLPAAGETFDVVVTHVNSPSDFYIQNISQNGSYLCKLTIDLQRYYSENAGKGFIYNPTEGMPCAALFSADRKWYRAKIVGIPGKKMVTVFYVDYGNSETISWTAIRKLKECFVKLPSLALNCILADILPVDGIWNDRAKSCMDKCSMIKGCSVHVRGRPKSKQKLKVWLYNEKETCVNGLLVDMGCAVMTTPNALWEPVDRRLERQSDISENSGANNQFQGTPVAYENEAQTSSCRERKPFRGRTFKDRNTNKLNAKTLREQYESEKKKFRKASSSEDNENEVEEFGTIFKVKVEILSAESPSSIYVTFPALMEEFKHLQPELNKFYENSSPAAIEWTPGSTCAVYSSARGSWYRCSVLSTLPNDQVKVFLKDVAQISSEPTSALRELDSSFTKFATCAVKCHLADIGPPGDQWPSICSEYLLSELENFNEIYMTKKGQIDNKSLPVELWVQKVITRGALEPISKEWITLNRLLVNQGLAIPTKQKMWCSSVPSNDEDLSDDVEELTVEQLTKFEKQCDKKDSNNAENSTNCVIPAIGSIWLPPEPLTKSEFTGMPTYVDFNAYVHMYDAEQDDEKLTHIRNGLLKEYENSKPSSEDHFWSPGQLCIARYHADDSWYRGIIVQINEHLTYDVLFVDYGNVETCQVSDLRKRIKMQEIPILSRTFQIQGIAPASEDGKWSVPVIDILHSLVVDKVCEVSVLKPSLDPSGPHVASLKVIGADVDVGGFLVDQGLASLTCNISDCVDAFEPSSSETEVPYISPKGEDRYIPLSIPDDCSGFLIQVTTVQSETEFFANIASDESISSDLKTLLSEFENLQQILTDKCHLQPLLEQPTEGQPCCCLHPRSNRWCRGEIENFMEKDNLVCVFYVDHGEKEFLNKGLLHECKSEWLRLPKMAVKFRLGNIQRNPNVSKSVYTKSLTSCLNHRPLFAEILRKHEGVLEVRLLTERNGPLAYQEMIDKELMTSTV